MSEFSSEAVKFIRLSRKIEKRTRKINASIALIKRAADAGILCMPDEQHVLLFQENENGEEGWVLVPVFEAAIDLTNSGFFRELKREINKGAAVV